MKSHLVIGRLVVGRLDRLEWTGYGWDFEGGHEPIVGVNTSKHFWGVSLALAREILTSFISRSHDDYDDEADARLYETHPPSSPMFICKLGRGRANDRIRLAMQRQLMGMGPNVVDPAPTFTRHKTSFEARNA